MSWIFQSIHSLINLLFFLAIAGTIVGSVWLSRRYKERFAEFPWGKTALLIVVEVVAWVVFQWLWSNWLIAAIAALIIIVILMKRKKKQEQVL